MANLVRNRCVLVCLLLLVLGGCGIVAKQKAGDFIEANQDYMMRLRWADLQGAALHLSPELRQDFIARFRQMKDLRLTDVETLQATPSEGQTEMTVRYQLEYYSMRTAQVKTYAWQQRWSLQQGQWLIVEPFPDQFSAQ